MSRNWLLAIGLAIAVIVAAVAIVLVLTDDEDAAGDRQATTEWAGAVCTSLTTWRSSLLALADVSAQQLTAETLRERIDDASEATERLVSDLRALGPPELDAGEELDRELEAIADDLEADYESLRASAEEALDTDSPTELIRGLVELAPPLQQALNRAVGTPERLEAIDLDESAQAELRQSFEEAPACRELGREER